MNKKIVAIWLSLIVFFSLITIIDITVDLTIRVEGSTLYVNETGSGGAYTSIQDAINAAKPGDTIFVYNGTYYENVVVNKTVNLTGENRDTTTINGGGNGDVVWIKSDWINISFFTIKNGDIWKSSSGLLVDSSHNTIISNNVSGNNMFGINLRYSIRNKISSNILSNNLYGIWLNHSGQNQISGNYAHSNDLYGIYIWYSNMTNIIDNNASNNDRGIWIDHSEKSNIIYNNISGNNDDGILLHYSNGNNITHNYASLKNGNGIRLSHSDNNNISNNNASLNIDYGIYLWYSFKNIVTSNNVSDNLFGIYFQYSDRNEATSNLLTNNSCGIRTYYSVRNNISANSFTQNRFEGISLSCSSENNLTFNKMIKDGIKIEGNQIEHWNTHYINTSNTANNKPIYYYKNQIGGIVPSSAGQVILANSTGVEVDGQELTNIVVGIELGFSSNNTIKSSNLSSNKLYGIYLYYSDSNTITNNTVSSNKDGIYILGSSDNSIYHNNIINNNNQAYDSSNNGNKWDNDYPMGGNYWSDFNGIDLNSTPTQDIPPPDGIGDTPYVIDSNSQDNYPLMEPYTPRSFDNYTILKQGWNLISLPLIQNNSDITEVLKMINGYYDVAQWYNIQDKNNPWKHHKIDKPFGNNLFELNETMGFWIHITNPGDTIFLYNGTQPTSNQTISLHPGWNMVGYPSLTSYNRTVGLNNLTFGTDVDAIWTFDAELQKWEEIHESDFFEIGRGYCVHATAECEWEVPL